MRFLMLAAALAFTASPALGQVRTELPQWAKEGNASDHPPLGLTYDLAWDEPQDDTKGARWNPILIGAATGLALGFAFGLHKDMHASHDLPCVQSISDPHGPCLNKDHRGPYEARIVFGLTGILAGGVAGWLWTLREAAAD